MKYKKRLQRLATRQSWFDKLPQSTQQTMTRPGSKKK